MAWIKKADRASITASQYIVQWEQPNLEQGQDWCNDVPPQKIPTNHQAEWRSVQGKWYYKVPGSLYRLQTELETTHKICVWEGSIFNLGFVSRYLSKHTLKIIYYATIEERLRFRIIFYGSGDITSIFVLQKRAIRVLFGLSRIQSCRGIFRTNKSPAIYAIYTYIGIRKSYISSQEQEQIWSTSERK